MNQWFSFSKKKYFFRQNKKQEQNSNQAQAILRQSNMGTDQPTNQPTDQLTDEVSYRGTSLAPKNG
jgi:hypothetical protein